MAAKLLESAKILNAEVISNAVGIGSFSGVPSGLREQDPVS
jgi:hypothetical protein